MSASYPVGSVYFYSGVVDNGMWVDGDDFITKGGVVGILFDHYHPIHNDIVAHSATWMASYFVGPHGGFDFEGFVSCRDHDHHGPMEARLAYLDFMGMWDADHFDETFIGFYGSKEDLAFDAKQNELNSVPHSIRRYIDFAKLADDLLINDYVMWYNYVFLNI